MDKDFVLESMKIVPLDIQVMIQILTITVTFAIYFSKIMEREHVFRF